MPFSNLFQTKKDQFLALDFGVSAVKGLLCSKTKNKVTVEKSGLGEIEKFGVFQAKDFPLDIVKSALDKALAEIQVSEKQRSKLPVLLSLPSDVLYAKVLHIDFARENEEQLINKAEKNKIYQLIGKEAGRMMFDIIAKEGLDVPEEFQILKEKILEKRIAGYRVPSILGFRGKKLNFKIVLIYAKKEKLKILQDILASSKIKNYSVCHQVEGLISLFSRISKASKIFVDIGGEMSRVFVFNNSLESVAQFSIGGNRFSRSLQKKFGLTQKGAESLKFSFTENKLSNAAQQKINDIFKPIFQDWLSQFEKVLRSQAKKMSFLSNKVILFGGGSLLSGFEEALNNSQWQAKPLDIKKLPLVLEPKQALSARFLPSLLLTFCKYEQ